LKIASLTGLFISFSILASVAHADPQLNIEFGDTETETKTETEIFENCSAAQQRVSFTNTSRISQSIEIANRRTTSAGATVSFGKIASLEVGGAIEDAYRSTFSTESVVEKGAELTVPAWKALEYTYDVIAVWRNGRLTVSDDSWFFKTDDKVYDFRHLASVEYRVRSARDLQKCLHTRDWRIKDTVELTNFRKVGGGDCEMDTNNNNSVKVAAEASLRNVQGNQLTLDVTFTMFEGRDDGSDGDTTLQDSQSIRLTMNDKPGYKIERIRTNPNFHLSKREVNRGKTWGLRTIPKSWLGDFFVREIKYELDGPGPDCDRAYASFFVEVPVRIIEDPDLK
jgi:hypothetical protein